MKQRRPDGTFRSYTRIELQELIKQRIKIVDNGQPTLCWEWQGSTHMKEKWNYGTISLNNKCTNAHRVSWEVFNGTIPKGLSVLHHCDTPLCVCPEHLFIGTGKDNIDDAVKKGRWPSKKGTANGCAKLTEDDVRQILKEQPRRHVARECAKRLGISVSVVQKILRRQTWSHITP